MSESFTVLKHEQQRDNSFTVPNTLQQFKKTVICKLSGKLGEEMSKGLTKALNQMTVIKKKKKEVEAHAM